MFKFTDNSVIPSTIMRTPDNSVQVMMGNMDPADQNYTGGYYFDTNTLKESKLASFLNGKPMDFETEEPQNYNLNLLKHIKDLSKNQYEFNEHDKIIMKLLINEWPDDPDLELASRAVGNQPNNDIAKEDISLTQEISQFHDKLTEEQKQLFCDPRTYTTMLLYNNLPVKHPTTEIEEFMRTLTPEQQEEYRKISEKVDDNILADPLWKEAINPNSPATSTNKPLEEHEKIYIDPSAAPPSLMTPEERDEILKELRSHDFSTPLEKTPEEISPTFSTPDPVKVIERPEADPYLTTPSSIDINDAEQVKEFQRKLLKLDKLDPNFNIDLGNTGANCDGVDGDCQSLTITAITKAEEYFFKGHGTGMVDDSLQIAIQQRINEIELASYNNENNPTTANIATEQATQMTEDYTAGTIKMPGMHS